MAQLVEMGLVRNGLCLRGLVRRGWFLTDSGRRAVREHGVDEVKP